MRIAVAAGLALALVPGSAQAGVLTVSPAGPADFHQIQDAVTAAVDGDVLLVEPGDYGPFTVTNKALDIEADGSPCTVSGTIHIASLAAGKAVVVRGIDGMAALAADPGEGMRIENCDGAVRVEGSVFQGSYESLVQPASPGVSIVSCAAVSMHDCRMVGGKTTMTSTFVAGTGLDVSGSASVSLWQCSCGGEGNYAAGGLPGPGATVAGSTLFAAGTTFGGGTQYVHTPVCTSGADGLDLTGGATAHLLDDLLVAGAGSPPVPPLCSSGGPDGLPISVDLASGSNYDILPGSAREFSATSPVREGQTLTLDFHGAPFEGAILMLSLSTQDVWAPGFHGTFQLGSPFWTLPLGTTDALGDFSFSTTAPELGPGVAGVTLYCQGFFHLPGPSNFVGPLSPMLLVDSAY